MMTSSLPSVSPELAFLIDACAPAPRTPVTLPGDWPQVIQLALRHRVYPRVWANRSDTFPPEQAAPMRAVVAENALAALRNVARTLEAVQLLRAAGLESLVLKGPLLAHDLYGDVALRVAGDIDLLVRETEFGRAAETLAAAGYRHPTGITPGALTRLRKREHDLAFFHPEDDTLIELHADIAQPQYGYRVDLEDWWRRRRVRALGADSVFLPSLEHAYLLAALHAAKHRWHRLDLVSDIAAFLRLGIDVDAVHQDAAKAWLLSLVRTGEAIAAWMFEEKASDSRLVRDAISQLIAGEELGRWTGMGFDLRLRERKAEKARYLWKRLVSAKLGL
jgi:hypothetical protein